MRFASHNGWRGLAPLMPAPRKAHAQIANPTVSNRIQVRPLFASKNAPSDGAKTGVAEPHVAEESRSWRAASGEQEVMRGS